jgi:hypothetical protein
MSAHEKESLLKEPGVEVGVEKRDQEDEVK